MPVIVHQPAIPSLSPEEIARWRKVEAAVAVDVTRGAGYVDPAIRPLLPPGQQPRLLGRAVTAQCEPPDFGAVPYALEEIKPGDVLVIAAGGETGVAMIGEVLGGYLRRRGGVGIVCDGAIRDVGILAGWTDLSVYTRGINPRGPASKERGAVNVPVVFGGCRVNPGDLLIGDDDGLAVLAPDAVRRCIADAEAVPAREQRWQASIASGGSLVETIGLPPPERR
jgi:regulator of RNase E activity RraA